jgi:hypothetical protein
MMQKPYSCVLASLRPLDVRISWRKKTYPLAFDRGERFKRSLVCTSSGFAEALLEGFFIILSAFAMKGD